MRAMVRYASSLGLVVLCGCGELSLDEMKSPELLMQVLSTFGDERVKPYITLSEGLESEPDGIQKRECPNLSGGTRAFLEDVEVPMEVPGGWHSSSGLGSPSYCSPTVFRAEQTALPLPGAQDVTRVRITEGDTTFLAETQGLCGPRSLRMSAPADSVLRSGQDVELEWFPATDVLLVTYVTLSTSGGTYELTRKSGALQIEGNHLRFRVPLLGTADAGEARVSLSGEGAFGLYEAGPTRCEGFASCRFTCWIQDVPWFVPVRVQGG